MIPLYGFLEGDSIGLLMLADGDETLAAVAARLQRAASTRIAPVAESLLEFWHDGKKLDPTARVGGCGVAALDRFDVKIQAN